MDFEEVTKSRLNEVFNRYIIPHTQLKRVIDSGWKQFESNSREKKDTLKLCFLQFPSNLDTD